MYNYFLKRINAYIEDHFPLKDINYKFVVKDADGKDVSDKIIKIISSGKKVTDKETLGLIANNVYAALAYMSKKDYEQRRQQILQVVPTLSLAFASEIDIALQYIMYVLGGNPNADPEFFNYLKDRLKQEPKDIPTFIWVTGYHDDDLINLFCDASSEVHTFRNVSEFFSALYKHLGKSGLESLVKDNPKASELVSLLREQISEGSSNQQSIPDIKQDNDTDSGNTLQDETVISFFNELKTYLVDDSVLDINELNRNSNVEEAVSDIYDNLRTDFKENLKTFIKDNADNVIEILDTYTNYDNLKNFVEQLKLKVSTANINRGNNMFKLSKAYTRYYIKNILAYKVKANNIPEALPQVVKVSTDEIQDLMYGDSVKHPENLSEIQNPAAKKQIFNDVEDAVEKISKGDLLEDGAADGMSIEDLAKKWAPMYNMQYEQMLDTLKTQEQAGSIVEQEHTDNLEIAKEIARDHLAEAPDYYTHLENMETLFPDENVAVKPLMEPENMDLKTVNPIPEDSDHVCDGSCGGNCKCHDKVQTVEDKIQDLSGDGIVVVMVSDSPEVTEEQPLDFIQQIAAKIKR